MHGVLAVDWHVDLVIDLAQPVAFRASYANMFAE